MGTEDSRLRAIETMDNYRARRLFGRDRGGVLVDLTIIFRDDGRIAGGEHVAMLVQCQIRRWTECSAQTLSAMVQIDEVEAGTRSCISSLDNQRDVHWKERIAFRR